MSKSLPVDVYIRLKAFKEAISTHNNININDVNKIYNLILNLLKTQKVNLDKYNYFLICTNKQTHTGKFCLSYNEYFDSYVQKYEEKSLTAIITDFNEKFFFECFDNKNLLEDEKKSLITQMNLEATTLKNTISKCIIDQTSNPNNVNNEIFKDLYPQTYFQNTLQKYTPPETYIILRETIDEVNFMYIFDAIPLLNCIHKENKNPETSKPFTDRQYANLTSKYALQLKMIARYHKGKII
jgi:hypothetical protein